MKTDQLLGWLGLVWILIIMFFLAEKFTFAGSELFSIGSGSVNFGCFFHKNNTHTHTHTWLSIANLDDINLLKNRHNIIHAW
jgi:hypothetical protein